MKAIFEAGTLAGKVAAPPSKSMAHRLLICSALAREKSTIENIAFSQDILATIDCLKSLGAEIEMKDSTILMNGENLFSQVEGELNCRESGSTLRFLIPFAWLTGKEVTFAGSERLLQRPLTVYEELAKQYGFEFKIENSKLITKGNLKAGYYQVAGNISSQFITGLVLALSVLQQESTIEVVDKFESKSYVGLTLEAMGYFDRKVEMTDNIIHIPAGKYHGKNTTVEADESNAAYLEGYNCLNNRLEVLGLNKDTIQGDRVYHQYFPLLQASTPTLDLADCPDLGPVVIALAAMLNGATFINTRRLAAKECDRGMAMKEELEKIGADICVEENQIVVKRKALLTDNICFDGHNDHRIVMALCLILNQFGGQIEQAEAVRKSFPDYFEKLQQVGAKVELYDSRC